MDCPVLGHTVIVTGATGDMIGLHGCLVQMIGISWHPHEYQTREIQIRTAL